MLVGRLAWNEEEVAEWLDQLKLTECREVLFSAGIDGKALLVLTAQDLQSIGIVDRIIQSRLLQEIYELKLRIGKGMSVHIDECFTYSDTVVTLNRPEYRFAVLSQTLVPISSDQFDKFKCMSTAASYCK